MEGDEGTRRVTRPRSKVLTSLRRISKADHACVSSKLAENETVTTSLGRQTIFHMLQNDMLTARLQCNTGSELSRNTGRGLGTCRNSVQAAC